MVENKGESINIINENIDKTIQMMPVIISLFGNEDMDITEFGLTNKSVFYRCSYGECFRFIADKCMHCCANPIPDTEMHINYLRRLPGIKKAVTDLGI